MATVADAARPVGAAPAPRPSRHCRLTIRIGGMDYRLRPCPPEPGILAAWVAPQARIARLGPLLRRRPQGPARPLHLPGSRAIRAGRASTSAPSPPPASSPAEPKPSPSRPQPQAPRQECPPGHRPGQAIVESRRPAPPAPAPALVPPEGWEPGGDHPSFAAGFRQAVSAHVARLRAPAVTKSAMVAAGEFDIQISGDPEFLRVCVAKEVRHEYVTPQSREAGPAAHRAAWAAPAARFVADQLERMAQLLKFTGAETPDQYHDRIFANEEASRKRPSSAATRKAVNPSCATPTRAPTRPAPRSPPRPSGRAGPPSRRDTS